MKRAFRAAVFAFALSGAAPYVLKLEGDIDRVHDPCIIKCKDTYYVFSTGGRPGAGVIPIRTSKDLTHWTKAGFVFKALPNWATTEIPGARGAWAPDISYYSHKYHLYYAVSTFGSRNSAIGLATNPSLDPSDREYQWKDEGIVVRSHQETDDWNAIDPNLVIENEHIVWLAWGSFWGGIKMRRVDPSTGKLSQTETSMYSLCVRPRKEPAGGSVESPFIVHDAGWWYLFASFDRCCRGANSTYNVVVGRANRVTGPYVDRGGTPMMDGGATSVMKATSPNWRGPGHEAILQERDQDYLVFHAYNGKTGVPYLQISTLVWENGWPRAGTLP